MSMQRTLALFLGFLLLMLATACGSTQPAASQTGSAATGGTTAGSTASGTAPAGTAPAGSSAPAATELQPIAIVGASPMAEKGDISQALTHFMQTLEERTGGKISVKNIFYGGTMGGFDELVPLLADGTIQVAVVYEAYYPQQFPIAAVTQVPFTSAYPDSNQRAYRDLLAETKELQAEYEKQNVKIVTMIGSTEAPLVTSKTRIQSLADLSGLRIRGLDMHAKVLQSWGATPVALAAPEIAESLARGVVDGSWGMGTTAVVSFGIAEPGKFWTDTGAGPGGLLKLGMNLDLYKSLPPDVQKLVDEIGEETDRFLIEKRFALHKNAVQNQKDVEFYRLPEPLLKELRERGAPVAQQAWIDSMKSHGYSEARAREILDRWIELDAKYAATSDWKLFIDLADEMR